MVRPTIHTNHGKTQLFENAPQTGGILRRRFFVFVWTEDELNENDDLSVFMWFHCPSIFKQKSKMTGGCCAFKFLQRTVNGIFKVNPPISDSPTNTEPSARNDYNELLPLEHLQSRNVTSLSWHFCGFSNTSCCVTMFAFRNFQITSIEVWNFRKGSQRSIWPNFINV